MMMIAVPLVSAQPISILQESLHFPQTRPTIKAPAIKVLPRAKKPDSKRETPVYRGTASWYSENDPSINLRTANGEIFDDSKLTCASWDFAFGTRLQVTNLANGKSVVCRVNDRGPHKRLKRLIDLTKSAFGKISSTRQGIIHVSVMPLPKS